MPGQVGSGVERLHGSSSMQRIQSGSGSAPAPDARAGLRQAGHGDGSAPYLNRVSIDEARRRENVNPDNEDDILMGNDSAPRETTWKVGKPLILEGRTMAGKGRG
ncbi:uncharacterized protein LOC119300609 [Triticum dicoccoides]|uniref:uncharacterized protein LOC119300609 n=1 Tax=Triticum dicoccoides TaxID=85692 RepID=UPI00189062F1|nr:uncharacterized protein LOC119300609 [Triticum dicoccoides]